MAKKITEQYVSDEQIAASVKRSMELLGKLKLTDAERKWAHDQAKQVFYNVSEAMLKAGDVRAVAVSAAIAVALSLANDWADSTDAMMKKMAEPH